MSFFGQLQLDGTAGILLALCIILFSGLLFAKIAGFFRLPKVTGYIVVGVLIGPSGLGLISPQLVAHMDFVSDIALACIAFGVGKFFKVDELRKAGNGILLITVLEALTAGVFVFLSTYCLFHTSLDFALLLGAVATATAPASTIMTIKQYHARGEFVRLLLQVVALDDAVCLLAFSFASAVVSADFNGSFSPGEVGLPLLYNLLAVLLGLLGAWTLSRFTSREANRESILILLLADLLGIAGICALLDVSPLLACMVFGMGYINLSRDKKLFRQLDHFTPPVMSLFFIESGMKLELATLRTAGVIGIVYFFIRILGKYTGAYTACTLLHKERKISWNLGLGLIPQAGVSIGLATLGQRILPPAVGSRLLTIILSSSVLYEMIGPACAKYAIFHSGSISERKKPK
ncbi:cation:proton antiporter [Ruminococcus gauvreauii]|uniref:cation:proton antiporter n=1 Tax=Ruminococcus gauvreauii TaxID=438033 RepID=UPI0039842D42